MPLHRTLILTSLALASGAADDPEAAGRELLRAVIAHVQLADGVDESEARILATAYFQAFVSGCGGVFGVADGGEAWVAETLVGRGARPGPRLRIAKRDGSISSASRPSVAFAHDGAGATITRP